MSDVNDLLGHGFGARGVVITESELGDGFFDLRTGLAGLLFQKFVQYHVPLAIVVVDPDRHGERFAELCREHRSHPQVRIVASMDDARAWLDG